jgi:RNA polymerase sigma-70 factor (ECF subfamily)
MFRPVSSLHKSSKVIVVQRGGTQSTNNNKDAFLARLEHYRSYLTLLARVQIGHRLQGKLDADDLVQETMLAAVASAKNFRGSTEAELTAWLRKILLSRVLKNVERFFGTVARDARRELRLLLDSSSKSLNALARSIPADHSTPSKAVQRRERAVVVANTLNVLPSDYRDVLVFRNMEGLSFPEIAERMGRTVGAVTMLWTRAVHQFRLAFPTES